MRGRGEGAADHSSTTLEDVGSKNVKFPGCPGGSAITSKLDSLSVPGLSGFLATQRNMEPLEVRGSCSDALKERKLEKAKGGRGSDTISNVPLVMSELISPTSSSQVMVGAGKPSAVQVRVTLSPSATVTRLKGFTVNSGETVLEGGGGGVGQVMRKEEEDQEGGRREGRGKEEEDREEKKTGGREGREEGESERRGVGGGGAVNSQLCVMVALADMLGSVGSVAVQVNVTTPLTPESITVS